MTIHETLKEFTDGTAEAASKAARRIEEAIVRMEAECDRHREAIRAASGMMTQAVAAQEDAMREALRAIAFDLAMLAEHAKAGEVVPALPNADPLISFDAARDAVARAA